MLKIRFFHLPLLLAMPALLMSPVWGDPNAKPNAIGSQLRSSLSGGAPAILRDADSDYAHLGNPRAPLYSPQGEIIGTYDVTVIRIEGKLVNHETVIVANAAKIRVHPDSREEVTSLVFLDDTVFLSAHGF